MNENTMFDGFPGRQYAFPIGGPFAGSNINYSINIIGDNTYEK